MEQTSILYSVMIYCILLAVLKEGMDRYRIAVACPDNCICSFGMGIAVSAFLGNQNFLCPEAFIEVSFRQGFLFLF